ncbi:MAG: hypothetical protein RLZZ303_1955 [Candidatus Hydrogenedentota bacterium]|jgi:hypothetical protein
MVFLGSLRKLSARSPVSRGEFIAVLVACLLTGPLAAGANEPASAVREYDLKAALVVKLSSFISWEEAKPKEGESPDREGELKHSSDASSEDKARVFSIAVLGDDPFGPVLDRLAGQAGGGKQSITVRRISQVSEIANGELVFVSSSMAASLPEVERQAEASHALTISDIKDFARTGGMVELAQDNNRVSLIINAKKADAAGILISSKLLSLAEVVNDG